MHKLKDYLLIATSIVVLIGLPLTLYQIYKSNQTQSANYMLEFNNELRNTNPSYSSLINALATGKPILAPKGTFTDEQVDNYLVMWELLDQFTQHRLISSYMAYDAFSYDVETAYCNSEIKSFVLENRQEDKDPSEYGGFTDLARSFLIQDKNQPCDANFIDSKNKK